MKRWSRREFTRHAGLATLFAPFVSLLNGSKAEAQAAGKAKYFLLFFTNGTDVGSWTPTGSSESSINFSVMTEPLSEIKDSVILVDGLTGSGTASGHGSPGGLCGMGYGNPIHISVDQFISDGLKKSGVNTQIPNLVLGGVTNEQQTTFFRNGQALSPVASPTTAYNAVFGGGGGATSTPGSDTPSVDSRLARRQSILDLMHAELDQLSRTLGSAEREKLEIHAHSIRQLEERLAAQSGTGGGGTIPVAECATPSAVNNGSESLLNSSALLQLSINAFACDLTRVASVQFGHHQSTQISLPEVGEPGDWHNGFAHSDPAPRQRLINVERWLCGEFVKAVQQLKSLPAPDGSGTLYDQTLIMWARDMGDSVVHDDSNMRFVFAGGAGGYLKHSANGRYLTGGGQRHLRALLNACDGMGVTDFAGFGDPAVSGADKTPLPQLTS